MPERLDPEDRALVAALVLQGLPFRAIARKTGVSDRPVSLITIICHP